MIDSMECSICAAKPGSPTLCRSCLHNRDMITKLRNLVVALDLCKPHIDNAFMMTYEVRGGLYDGPTYQHELAAARETPYDNRERSLHRLGNDSSPQAERSVGEAVEGDSENPEQAGECGEVGRSPQVLGRVKLPPNCS